MAVGDTMAWPDGKRVAVMLSVNLECWEEDKGPSYFPRTTPLSPGLVDLGAVQWGGYGGREGIWRLMRVLDRNSFKASVFCSGRTAELHADAIDQAVASGHMIEAHGWAQNQFYFDMKPDEQRASIRRTLDALERASGRRPQGWLTPAYGSDGHTSDLLAQEGLTWYTDGLDTSLPCREKTSSSSIVRLPWSDFVDNRVLRSNPRDYFDVYHDTFAYLYDQEPGGLLHLAVHCHHGGRPHIAAQLDKLLRHVSQFTDVWFTTHAEIARWFDGLGVDDLSYARRFPRPDAARRA